jgi:uncharacterized RDD family membrane protein YckC
VAATAGWPLASWGQRAGAFLLDWLLVSVFVVAGSVVLGVSSAVARDGGSPPALALLFGILCYLGALVFWVWNMAVRQGSTGQSLGKTWLGIRVAREADGAAQGILLSLVRGLLHYFIDGALCYLGYLWPLWDVKNQTFTDKILSTVVVDVNAGAPPAA